MILSVRSRMQHLEEKDVMMVQNRICISSTLNRQSNILILSIIITIGNCRRKGAKDHCEQQLTFCFLLKKFLLNVWRR